MARNTSIRIPVTQRQRLCAYIQHFSCVFFVWLVLGGPGAAMHRCQTLAAEAAASRHRATTRADLAAAVAALPASPVRRSLLKALSASYGVSFTWPFPQMTSTKGLFSSNNQDQEPSLDWYTDSRSSSTDISSSSTDLSSSDSSTAVTNAQPQSGSSTSSSPSPSANNIGSAGGSSTSTSTSTDGGGSGSSTDTTSDNSNSNPCWRSDGNGGGTEFLTVESRCPNDDFNIAIIEYNSSWTWDGTPTVYGVYFSGGWAVVKGVVSNQQVRPRQQDGDSGQAIAVIRAKDQKWIAPKGVRFDSTTTTSSSSRIVDGAGSTSSSSETLFDLSGSKRQACVLVGESSDRPFPRFRIVVKSDSNRVLANSVAALGEPIFKGSDGVYCEDLKQEPVLGYNYQDRDYTQGRLADAYDPSGCKFVIDDCSS